MKTFEIAITLISETIEYSAEPDDLFSDPNKLFDYNFYNCGGSEIAYDASPCLKDKSIPLSKNSHFYDLYNKESEVFEGSSISYKIEEITGNISLGWNYNFCLLLTFFAKVEAETLDMALTTLKKEVLDILAIYDAVVDEILGIQDVKLVLKDF